MSEEQYIRQRKEQAEQLGMLFEEAYKKYPVKKNKIVFSSFEGDGGFCCNPRYIAEELYKMNKDIEMVWLVHDVTKEFPSYITVAEDSVENTVYHLATAKIWVDNYRKPYGTKKRNGQIYIQTWHGSLGIKAVGLYRGEAFPKIARIVSEWDSSLCDYVLSNSDYNDKIYPKKLLYQGPTLRTGFPRIDCLINDREALKKQIREQYHIEQDTKLLLFAPTFRGGNQKEKKNVISEVPEVDFESLFAALETKYKCRWKVLLRLHPQLSAKMDQMFPDMEDDRFIDVSQEPDVSQVLGGCDLVVTDYSSIAFDAGFSKIPVLLYMDDLQEYMENRGKLMWKKEELPFSVAETCDELIENIECFSGDAYEKNMDMFMKQYGIVEDGKAGWRVAKFLLTELEK